MYTNIENADLEVEMRRDVESLLKRDVVALATEDGRMVGTPGHDRARVYLEDRLRGIGIRPYGPTWSLPYEAQGIAMANVVGVVPGRRPDLDPVLIGAHYDTCGPLPGADDNAAAVAIALWVGERLVARPAERSVIVALFDGEEPPWFLGEGMGSLRWYRDQRQTPVHAAVILDLVGHDLPVPGREDLVFALGGESDPGIAALLGEVSVEGIRIHPALNRYVGDLSDHHAFRVDERPYLFLSCGRWQHYHQPTDTPDKLNYAKMARIAELVQVLAVRLSESELDGPFGEGETLGLELDAIAAHFGGLLGPFKPRTRAGVDRFIGLALRLLGL